MWDIQNANLITNKHVFYCETPMDMCRINKTSLRTGTLNWQTKLGAPKS